MHENTELNTDLLKNELGFGGFLISDWEGIDKLAGSSYAEKVAKSVNSGLDMAMAPYNFEAFIAAVTAAVESNTIAQSRVDDAVRRILTEKFAAGLFEEPFALRTNTGNVGSDEHRTVARRAAAESQVLLKNDGVLPLAQDATVYLTGSTADDLGRQLGGWSISWQGGAGPTTTGTTIGRAIAAVVGADKVVTEPTPGAIGVAVVGERPYAEGQGDVGNNGFTLELSAEDQQAITDCRQADKCVVLVVSGRPLVVPGIAEIDGLVASWLPGTEGTGVADTLFGQVPFTGRLPVTWPATAKQVPVNVGDAARVRIAILYLLYSSFLSVLTVRLAEPPDRVLIRRSGPLTESGAFCFKAEVTPLRALGYTIVGGLTPSPRLWYTRQYAEATATLPRRNFRRASRQSVQNA